DEVADMSLNAQAKVLRVIQDLIFQRVGGEESIQTDVRVIAATNKDILEEVRKKNFREDLYYRLNVIPITVPPLRERVSDLPLLLNYFFEKYRPKEEPLKSVSPEGLTILENYRWPGNIRELKNFVERVTIMADEEVISKETVEYYLGKTLSQSGPAHLEKYLDMKLNDAKDNFEREFIESKLEENAYNISKTAEVLGVYPSNLHGKIKKLGIQTKK
ncbi:MAG: sigma 54-interacting transcriptional regulator, partial [Spirochaetia bacterium]